MPGPVGESKEGRKALGTVPLLHAHHVPSGATEYLSGTHHTLEAVL